jgi:hypothetical protein
MTFEFEYLCEFDFEFDWNLGKESGDQGFFWRKNGGPKYTQKHDTNFFEYKYTLAEIFDCYCHSTFYLDTRNISFCKARAK